MEMYWSVLSVVIVLQEKSYSKGILQLKNHLTEKIRKDSMFSHSNVTFIPMWQYDFWITTPPPPWHMWAQRSEAACEVIGQAFSCGIEAGDAGLVCAQLSQVLMF